MQYRFRRWRNLPGQRTEFQPNVEVDGHIVCWTHRQIDGKAEWPHIEPVESYRARFGDPLPICPLCGSTEEPHHCQGLYAIRGLRGREAKAEERQRLALLGSSLVNGWSA